jgi:hypothetical protein
MGQAIKKGFSQNKSPAICFKTRVIRLPSNHLTSGLHTIEAEVKPQKNQVLSYYQQPILSDNDIRCSNASATASRRISVFNYD